MTETASCKRKRTVVVVGAERRYELRFTGRRDPRVGQRVDSELVARKAGGVGQDGRIDSSDDGQQPDRLIGLDQPVRLARVRNRLPDDLADDTPAPNPVLLLGGRVQALVDVGLLEREET